MKITQLEILLVAPRWQFLKVSTDEGIVGWGEPVVVGRAEAVASAVREIGEWVIGCDPNEIGDIWQTIYRGGFFRGGPILMSALAGIDQALWDIKGQRYGQPVHQLLSGPVRSTIRVYAWIGGATTEELARAARARVAAGYTAIKMNGPDRWHVVDSFAKVDAIVERVGAVRSLVMRANDSACSRCRTHRPDPAAPLQCRVGRPNW